jgi:hypothetical protein
MAIIGFGVYSFIRFKFVTAVMDCQRLFRLLAVETADILPKL